MAVNDLMMRIQLLADTGKSTAELKRLQTQLQALTNQLKALERTSLSPLANDLKTIKAAQNDLKATNLQTFAKTLNEVKKSFSGLGVSTSGVDQLKQAYLDLQQQIAKTAVETQKHAQETKILNARLAETKKNQLTGDGQSVNQKWIDTNDELKKYTNGIRLANEYIREERQYLSSLKGDLRNVNSLYAQQRVSLGQASLSTLTRKTEFDTTNLKLWKDTLNSVKSDVVKFKDELRQTQIASKAITLKQGISDALVDSNSQLAKLTAQQKLYNKDLLDSKSNITAFKNTLSEIRDSNKVSFVNGNDIRSIATIKSGLRDLKAQQKDALKLQFDPTPVQLFDKFITRANASSRKIVPKFDNTSITSLEDYNNQLIKQQQSVLKTQGVVKSYQNTLRALRLELQTAGTPNFDRRNGNLLNDILRIKNEIQSINSSKGIMIEVDDKGIQKFVGGSLTSLQNKLREIKNTGNTSKANDIAPINAQVKAYNAEYDVLKQINTAYKEKDKARASGNIEQYRNSLNDIERLEKSLVGLNSKASAYTGDQSLIQRRMTELEQEAALGKLKSSLVEQTNVKYQQQAAQLNKLIGQQKNQISLKNDEKKAIENLIASERTRARLAANDVKTRNGGLFDTVSSKNSAQNEVDLYRGNVAALKQYLSTLKQVAQVRGETFSGRISALSNELQSALGLESAQKRRIADEQRIAENTKSNLRANKASRDAEVQSIQSVIEANKRDNLLTQEGIKSRVAARQQDITNIQETIARVKQRIEVDKQALTSYKEGLNAYRDGVQQQIFEAQQRIALGQLTKQQYNEERTAIRAALAEQKDLSKAYQQQLLDKKASLDLALKAEKASSASLKNQVKDLMLLRTEEARSKAVDLTRQYNASQTSQGSLQQQIKETEASAKAEILRANALAQSSKQTKENAGNVLGLKSSLQGSLRPVREFTAALGFMFGPQMAGFAAAGTILGLTDAFISANKQVEQLVRGLNAISSGNGKAEFQYLVDVSNKLGVSIQESAHSFLQLEATTAGTAIEGAKTKQIFESFARALNVTGADAVTFNRAFRSISQSLSKGQLYAEELKGQLAEALPGAIQVFAKAIDVTPKKFLAMVKAGQFAGQTLYDLYALVAKQLDKTYKVGGEKDFTFVQKANLAKNAFVELSVALGNTGIWATLSSGMLLLRDGLKSATESIPDLSDTLTAEWAMIKALYGDGAKDLVDSLGIIGDGWRELAKLIPDSINNISFKSLLDLPITIKKAANDALIEIKAMVIATKAAIDGVFGAGTSDSIDIGAGLQMEWEWFKGTIASAGEAAAALNIYIDKLKEAKEERSSIMPEGRKARPFTEEMLPFETFLKSYRATNIDVPISVSNETISKLKNQLDYLNGLLVKTTDPSKQERYRGFIKQTENQIESEIAGQRQLKDATVQENYNKWQALLKQNEAYEKEVLANAKKNAGIIAKVESDIAVVRQEGGAQNQAVDQQKKIRDAAIEASKSLRESTKREEQRLGFYQSYNQQLTKGVIEKEKDIAITKNQLAYEKKILDIKQEQRDAQVGFAKARYQEWVKTGSLTQESADFLTKSAENTSALKSIRDAKDAVEAYNNEKNKGADANDEELKLLRSNALELLKLGSEKARQVANEYEYNKLVEERKRLLAEEKTAANEGADAVYKAKIKAENPKAESDAAQKSLQDEASKTPITYRAIIKPEFDSSLPAQQSGLMFSSLRQEYQQTQQVFDNKLRVTVDDAQVNEALQSLTLYQSKIQDIQLKSLPNGQTEIIVTPKINESALQQGFQFIKTAATQASPTVTVKPVVDSNAVAAVKKTSEEVKKDILSILDKDGKKVNFIVVANGVKKTDEEMKRLSAQKEIPVTAFADQSSLDETKKKLDDLGQQIQKGLIRETTISPQGIQQTLDTAFGKDKYKLEIVPTLTGGVTEDGWIKNNEIKRNLIITPIEGDTSIINGMIEQQTNNVKSGFDNAWQMLREFDAKNQTVIESTPIEKQAKLDTTVALEEDAVLVAQLSTTVTKYVDIIYRSSGSDGATVKAATGGYLSGYGGGDRIHALLEAGEFILRKEAVRKLGLNNVFALNNLNIPKPSRSVDNMSIPSFSGGGYVGSSNTININVPGSKSIQVSGSRESAMALANLLTRVGRAA